MGMRAKNIWVIGGDPRQTALAGLLGEEGHSVHLYGLEEAAACEGDLRELGRADCVILPLPAEGERGMVNTPLSRRVLPSAEVADKMRPGQLLCAGMARPELQALAAARGVILRDYFAREELAVLNAIPTAEGAIRIAMEELPITLHDARVLILGFGRIGQALALRLRGLGVRVTAAVRRHDRQALARSMGVCAEGLGGLRAWLCAYDLVINTIPAPVLGREELAALKEGTPVIDLASRPGGVDFAAADELGVRTVHALSLPGKEAPVTAGRYIMDTVYHIMEEMGV